MPANHPECLTSFRHEERSDDGEISFIAKSLNVDFSHSFEMTKNLIRDISVDCLMPTAAWLPTSDRFLTSFRNDIPALTSDSNKRFLGHPLNSFRLRSMTIARGDSSKWPRTLFVLIREMSVNCILPTESWLPTSDFVLSTFAPQTRCNILISPSSHKFNLIKTNPKKHFQ